MLYDAKLRLVFALFSQGLWKPLPNSVVNNGYKYISIRNQSNIVHVHKGLWNIIILFYICIVKVYLHTTLHLYPIWFFYVCIYNIVEHTLVYDVLTQYYWKDTCINPWHTHKHTHIKKKMLPRPMNLLYVQVYRQKTSMNLNRVFF